MPQWINMIASQVLNHNENYRELTKLLGLNSQGKNRQRKKKILLNGTSQKNALIVITSLLKNLF